MSRRQLLTAGATAAAGLVATAAVPQPARAPARDAGRRRPRLPGLRRRRRGRARRLLRRGAGDLRRLVARRARRARPRRARAIAPTSTASTPRSVPTTRSRPGDFARQVTVGSRAGRAEGRPRAGERWSAAPTSAAWPRRPTTAPACCSAACSRCAPATTRCSPAGPARPPGGLPSPVDLDAAGLKLDAYLKEPDVMKRLLLGGAAVAALHARRARRAPAP